MAAAANSLLGGSFKAASGLAAYPTPVEWYGYLDGTGVNYESGDVLINASGLLNEAAENPANTTVIGILGPVSPRRQHGMVLTSGTAPDESLANHRETPATGTPNFTNANDTDFGVLYYPAIPGNIFAAHTIDSTTQGTDIRADSQVDIFNATVGVSFTLTAGAANSEINYATRAGIWLAIHTEAGVAALLKPFDYLRNQPTTAAANAVVATPGKLAETAGGGGATDTFNPMMVMVFGNSHWIGD